MYYLYEIFVWENDKGKDKTWYSEKSYRSVQEDTKQSILSSFGKQYYTVLSLLFLSL